MNTPTVNHLRGLLAVRYLKALAIAKGDTPHAIAYAASQNWHNTPAVLSALKAAAGAMNTEDEAALLGTVGFDYAEFLRPMTIIGRLLGFRRVPFNVNMLAQAVATAANFVGESDPKPISQAEFTRDSLPPAKVAAIAVVTQELVRSSAPSAEGALSVDLSKAGAQALDVAFIDPANAGIVGAKPPSITNGAPQFPSSGSSLANIDSDLETLINSLIEAGSDLAFAAWVMRPRSAVYLSRLRGTGGAPAFPGMTARGGVLLGLPVVTSGNVPIASGSGDPSSIVLLDPSQIALADDGDATLSVTTEATVQMETAPETGAAEQVSLWQMNLAGLRAERMVNWKRRHPAVAATLTGVTY